MSNTFNILRNNFINSMKERQQFYKVKHTIKNLKEHIQILNNKFILTESFNQNDNCTKSFDQLLSDLQLLNSWIDPNNLQLNKYFDKIESLEFRSNLIASILYDIFCLPENCESYELNWNGGFSTEDGSYCYNRTSDIITVETYEQLENVKLPLFYKYVDNSIIDFLTTPFLKNFKDTSLYKKDINNFNFYMKNVFGERFTVQFAKFDNNISIDIKNYPEIKHIGRCFRIVNLYEKDTNDHLKKVFSRNERISKHIKSFFSKENFEQII